MNDILCLIVMPFVLFGLGMFTIWFLGNMSDLN